MFLVYILRLRSVLLRQPDVCNPRLIHVPQSPSSSLPELTVPELGLTVLQGVHAPFPWKGLIVSGAHGWHGPGGVLVV